MTIKEMLSLEDLSKEYDERNIPLYLSYPVTSWWKQSPDIHSYTSFIREPDPNMPPFLYFHFPFCENACYYCCCYKLQENKSEAINSYIDYLIREFNIKRELSGKECFDNITQIHWGGGTPSFITLGQWEKIGKNIFEKINIPPEPNIGISIEAYPDKKILTPEKLKKLRALGFNEISFGVQDFDPRIQQSINRNCREQDLAELCQRARDLGFRIHLDLCYGLPFQGLNEIRKTAESVGKIGPDKIAVYSYAHYPLYFPLQNKIPASALPNSFIKILLLKELKNYFSSSGYKSIGGNHFVKPDNALHQASNQGKVIRDFMGYSASNRQHCLGFGLSSISFVNNSYYHNHFGLKDYYNSLDKKELPFEPQKSHKLSQEDLIRKQVILQNILCSNEIDKQAISQEFKIDFNEYFQNELTLLKTFYEKGLIRDQEDQITITSLGKNVIRHIAHVFDLYYRN